MARKKPKEETKPKKKSKKVEASPVPPRNKFDDIFDDRIQKVEGELRKLQLKSPCYSKRLPNDESWRLYFPGLGDEEQTLVAMQQAGGAIQLVQAPRYIKASAMKVLGDMLEQAKRDKEKEEEIQ